MDAMLDLAMEAVLERDDIMDIGCDLLDEELAEGFGAD